MNNKKKFHKICCFRKDIGFPIKTLTYQRLIIDGILESIYFLFFDSLHTVLKC